MGLAQMVYHSKCGFVFIGEQKTLQTVIEDEYVADWNRRRYIRQPLQINSALCRRQTLVAGIITNIGRLVVFSRGEVERERQINRRRLVFFGSGAVTQRTVLDPEQIEHIVRNGERQLGESSHFFAYDRRRRLRRRGHRGFDSLVG